jgi:hypothetical protein
MVVIALGSRSISQQVFGLLQMAARLSHKHSQLAVDSPRFLEFAQKRADRLGPPGILP